jgi:hypothetical protein
MCHPVLAPLPFPSLHTAAAEFHLIAHQEQQQQQQQPAAAAAAAPAAQTAALQTLCHSCQLLPQPLLQLRHCSWP